MATPIRIEEESGTFTRTPRRHNGYYAGDFSKQPVRDPFLQVPEARQLIGLR
jgi:hypothetical protein